MGEFYTNNGDGGGNFVTIRVFRSIKSRPTLHFNSPRVDTSIFKTDHEAEKHVIREMDTGSTFHAKAWSIIVRSSVEQRRAS